MSDKQLPSLTATAIASTLFGLLIGYFLGTGSSIGIFSSTPSSTNKKPPKSWPNNYDVDPQMGSDTSDEEFINSITLDKKNTVSLSKKPHTPEIDSENESEDQISEFADSKEEVKMVLVVRTDLGMTKGKIAAQCGHATLACYKALLGSGSTILKRWEGAGQTKVAVQCKSEEELETMQGIAVSLGLCAKIIHDAGRTQIAAGSATVMGVIGPKSVVDKVTGNLKLL